jgi:hypothetical protein
MKKHINEEDIDKLFTQRVRNSSVRFNVQSIKIIDRKKSQKKDKPKQNYVLRIAALFTIATTSIASYLLISGKEDGENSTEHESLITYMEAIELEQKLNAANNVLTEINFENLDSLNLIIESQYEI